MVVDGSAVDLALLELAANGTALDTGQAALARQMCTSGARVQLAIGQVIGLAPSAAAAAVLSEEAGIPSDTLAKLSWSLQHGELPDWAASVGLSTLIIIDEPGWPTPSPSTRLSSSRSAVLRVSGWSVMINNSPPSGVPAASSARSPTAMAHFTSSSSTASQPLPKPQPPSPSAKATPRR
jgi:hypothetical protein